MTVLAELNVHTAEVVSFWVLSVVALGAAVALVTMRNVVHAALMLVVNFMAMAGLFLLLQTPFLMIIQVIIYAGAIMVLFLFVIMLLGVRRDDLMVERDRWLRAGAWAVALLLMAAVTFVFVGPYTSPASVCQTTAAAQRPEATRPPGREAVGCAGIDFAEDQTSVNFVAERMFGRYTFAFEFVSLLLVVAIVGAMVVGRRRDVGEFDGGLAAEEVRARGPLTDLAALTPTAPHDHVPSSSPGGETS